LFSTTSSAGSTTGSHLDEAGPVDTKAEADEEESDVGEVAAVVCEAVEAEVAAVATEVEV
jgi:hypothetical protein